VNLFDRKGKLVTRSTLDKETLAAKTEVVPNSAKERAVFMGKRRIKIMEQPEQWFALSCKEVVTPNLSWRSMWGDFDPRAISHLETGGKNFRRLRYLNNELFDRKGAPPLSCCQLKVCAAVMTTMTARPGRKNDIKKMRNELPSRVWVRVKMECGDVCVGATRGRVPRIQSAISEIGTRRPYSRCA
jgi:hypothetical protein